MIKTMFQMAVSQYTSAAKMCRKVANLGGVLGHATPLA